MIFDGLIGTTGGEPAGGTICACAGADSSMAAARITGFMAFSPPGGTYGDDVPAVLLRCKIALSFSLSSRGG
jgi:hypothetical protein